MSMSLASFSIIIKPTCLFECQRFTFYSKNHKFVFIVGGRDYYDVVQTVLDDSFTVKDAFEAIVEYMLQFCEINRTSFVMDDYCGCSYNKNEIDDNEHQLYFAPRQFINRCQALNVGIDMDKDYKIARMLYNQALNVDDKAMKFFFLWKALEVKRNPQNDTEETKKWVSEQVANNYVTVNYNLLNKYTNKTVQDFLANDCRNAVAHTVRLPNRPQAKFVSNYDDFITLSVAIRIIEPFVLKYLEELKAGSNF